MTKAELHQMVDRLPDQAVDGAAILLREVTDGRIDPEQAWFWTREWQQREREADKDLASGRVTRFESDEEFLAALDERTMPTREVLASFWRDWDRLSPKQQREFRAAVAQFIADLAEGKKGFHPRLR